jgi:hypothetical protein
MLQKAKVLLPAGVLRLNDVVLPGERCDDYKLLRSD